MTQNVQPAEVADNAIDQPGAVAIVHDYLTQKGGAERVVLAMHRAFPAAPIYTSLYEPDLTFPEFRDVDVRPSYLNRSQFLRRHHRLALPLLAHAFSRLEIDEKVVLCSSSGWAHGIRTRDEARLLPLPGPLAVQESRLLSQEPGSPKERRHVGSSLDGIHTSFLFRNSLRLATPILRRWDRRAAASASEYYTKSSTISDEISSSTGYSRSSSLRLRCARSMAHGRGRV